MVRIKLISEELRLKYPNSKQCNDKDCKFTDRDHEVFMAHEQRVKEAERKGMIRTMYNMNYPEPDTKFFLWFNGKEWIELK